MALSGGESLNSTTLLAFYLLMQESFSSLSVINRSENYEKAAPLALRRRFCVLGKSRGDESFFISVDIDM
jgi:hypothetical protein